MTTPEPAVPPSITVTAPLGVDVSGTPAVPQISGNAVLGQALTAEKAAVSGLLSGTFDGMSTKVVASAGVASIAAPLVSVADYYIGHSHLAASVTVPVTALVSTVIIGGLSFVAGYLRKELARLK